MENKENVYQLNESAGQLPNANAGGEERTPPENRPTAPSKFKDVDALTRAYESLQAEFTRRSQRLRALEKWAENLGEIHLPQSGSGAEKLRKNAQMRRAEKKAFDEFVADVGRAFSTTAETESAKEPEPETADKPLEKDTETGSSLTEEREVDVKTENGLEKVKAERWTAEGLQNSKINDTVAVGGDTSVAESVKKDLSADALYGQVLRNEEVRLKIIGEYLASVGKTAPPLTLGGVGAFAMQPKRVESIGDAGDRALLYFKNKKGQAQNE